jgi:hypothetical protein
MATADLSPTLIGWLAIGAGIVGLFGFVSIALFFSFGQPFGSINDACIGMAAVLSVVLAYMLHPRLHGQSPLLSRIALVMATLGSILVLVGSVLAISGAKGWFLSGLYMAAGNALIGLWLVAVCYFAMKGRYLPQAICILGIVVGIIMALGVVTFPGIIRGSDPNEYNITVINAIWWVSSLAYLSFYPVWCILLGRRMVFK